MESRTWGGEHTGQGRPAEVQRRLRRAGRGGKAASRGPGAAASSRARAGDSGRAPAEPVEVSGDRP